MKLSIRAKLLGSYALMLMLTLAIGLTGIWSSGVADTNNAVVMDQTMPMAALVYRARSELYEKDVIVRNYLISQDEETIAQFQSIDDELMATIEEARAVFPDEQSHSYLDAVEATKIQPSSNKSR